jgi:hypothetical protein
MKWIALRNKSKDDLRVMRLFDNDGKCVATVTPAAEDDFVFETRVNGKWLGDYCDLEAAMRAVHREFKLPDFKKFEEIVGDLEPVEQPFAEKP